MSAPQPKKAAPKVAPQVKSATPVPLKAASGAKKAGPAGFSTDDAFVSGRNDRLPQLNPTPTVSTHIPARVSTLWDESGD